MRSFVHWSFQTPYPKLVIRNPSVLLFKIFTLPVSFNFSEVYFQYKAGVWMFGIKRAVFKIYSSFCKDIYESYNLQPYGAGIKWKCTDILMYRCTDIMTHLTH